MMKKKAILIKVEDEDFAKIRQASQERRLPMSTFIRMLVVERLQQEQTKGG